MNIMMLLEMACSGMPDRIAFSNGETGEHLTYQQLFNAAGAAAQLIKQSRATRTAVIDISSLALPIALFGSAWAGVPYVPINYRLTDAEIRALLARVKPAFLVTDSERATTLSAEKDVIIATRDNFIAQHRSALTPTDNDWSMDEPIAAAIEQEIQARMSGARPVF